jgi:hypothetical protein
MKKEVTTYWHPGKESLVELGTFGLSPRLTCDFRLVIYPESQFLSKLGIIKHLPYTFVSSIRYNI